MGYKFIQTPYIDSDGTSDGKTITVEMAQDSSWVSLLEAFEQFLRSSGYSFDGHFDRVRDEDTQS